MGSNDADTAIAMINADKTKLFFMVRFFWDERRMIHYVDIPAVVLSSRKGERFMKWGNAFYGVQ